MPPEPRLGNRASSVGDASQIAPREPKCLKSDLTMGFTS